MRWNVRTLGHEAHVTEVTVIHDLPEHLPVDAVQLAARRFVDGIEQRGEGVAEAETPPAAVADIEDPLQLFHERGLVVERRIAPVERVTRGRLETALAAAGRVHAHRTCFRANRAPSGSGWRASAPPSRASRTSPRSR